LHVAPPNPHPDNVVLIKIDFSSAIPSLLRSASDVHDPPISPCYKVKLEQSKSLVQRKKTLKKGPLLGSPKNPRATDKV